MDFFQGIGSTSVTALTRGACANSTMLISPTFRSPRSIPPMQVRQLRETLLGKAALRPQLANASAEEYARGPLFAPESMVLGERLCRPLLELTVDRTIGAAAQFHACRSLVLRANTRFEEGSYAPSPRSFCARRRANRRASEQVEQWIGESLLAFGEAMFLSAQR